MKRILSTALVVLMVLSLPVAAMAQQPAAITKGEFVRLLFDKTATDLGGMTYGDYASKNGILIGGGSGSLGLDDPLTYGTAGIILSRYMGFSSFDAQVTAASEYAHAAEYGLLPENAEANAAVTQESAESIVSGLAANMESAREFVNHSNEQTTDKFRFDIDMSMQVLSDGKTADMPAQMSMNAVTKTEVDLNTGIHQIVTSSMEGADQSAIEEYILKDGIYAKAADKDGKETWTVLKGLAMPDLKQQTEISPEQTKGMDKYVTYRDMGEVVVDGQKLRRIDAFLNIKDMNYVDQALDMAGMGDTMKELLQGQNAGDMFRGMYGKIVYYIDPETNLVKSADIQERVDFNPDFKVSDQPISITSEQILLKAKYYDYNSDDIKIELPDEAKNAEVIDMTKQM